jgi:hypothetical protein
MVLEISLLDYAYQRSGSGGDDLLISTAKRYRVDAEKIGMAVATAVHSQAKELGCQADDEESNCVAR